jgi:hypothetical protein
LMRKKKSISFPNLFWWWMIPQFSLQYFLFLVSQTIKDEFLRAIHSCIILFNVNDNEDLRAVFPQFQNFFKGEDMNIHHEKHSISKEIQHIINISVAKSGHRIWKRRERK